MYTLDELYAATQPKKIQQLIQQLLGGGGAARSKLSPFMQFCTARRAEWKARPTPYSRGERSRASPSPVPGRTLRTGRPAWPQRLVLSASLRGAVCQHRLLALF